MTFISDVLLDYYQLYQLGTGGHTQKVFTQSQGTHTLGHIPREWLIANSGVCRVYPSWRFLER